MCAKRERLEQAFLLADGEEESTTAKFFSLQLLVFPTLLAGACTPCLCLHPGRPSCWSCTYAFACQAHEHIDIGPVDEEGTRVHIYWSEAVLVRKIDVGNRVEPLEKWLLV